MEQQSPTTMTTDERHRLLNLASDLLTAVWTEIDPEYKSKYRMDIWTQFETGAAACARTTNNLDRFLSQLCGKVQVASPGHDESDRRHINSILQGDYCEPGDILHMLRDYPQVCVLKVRIANDERKSNYVANNADATSSQL